MAGPRRKTLILTNNFCAPRSSRGSLIEIPGFLGIDLVRRSLETSVEFVTIMWFESTDAVRAFAGPDYEAAVVPPAAQSFLDHFDARSAHYDVRERRSSQ